MCTVNYREKEYNRKKKLEKKSIVSRIIKYVPFTEVTYVDYYIS